MSLYVIESLAGLALTGVFIALQPPDLSRSASSSIRGVQTAGLAVAGLVIDGRERSPTFRKLLGEVDESDWIVFVQTGSCRVPGVVGCLLHQIGTFQGRQYLRIVISGGTRSDDEVIATIGHELQHAVEVVSEPGIAKSADIRELYRRIGYVSMRMSGGQLFETRRAVTAGSDILRELRAARGASERPQPAER